MNFSKPLKLSYSFLLVKYIEGLFSEIRISLNLSFSRLLLETKNNKLLISFYHTIIMAEKKLVGKVTHYYGKIGVAVVELEDELKVGDKISIEGKKTNIQQIVESMEIEHQKVQSASKTSIGLKTIDKVREGDLVYKIIE
jgi:putative protease